MITILTTVNTMSKTSVNRLELAGLGVVLLCFVIVPYICRLVLISVSKIAREKAPVRAIASEITTNTAHTDSKY